MKLIRLLAGIFLIFISSKIAFKLSDIYVVGTFIIGILLIIISFQKKNG